MDSSEQPHGPAWTAIRRSALQRASPSYFPDPSDSEQGDPALLQPQLAAPFSSSGTSLLHQSAGPVSLRSTYRSLLPLHTDNPAYEDARDWLEGKMQCPSLPSEPGTGALQRGQPRPKASLPGPQQQLGPKPTRSRSSSLSSNRSDAKEDALATDGRPRGTPHQPHRSERETAPNHRSMGLIAGPLLPAKKMLLRGPDPSRAFNGANWVTIQEPPYETSDPPQNPPAAVPSNSNLSEE